MSILSWNCRGLKNLSPQSLGFISNLASSNSLDFIFISETKSQVSSLQPMFSRLGYQNCTGFNSVDNRGGLFLCWSRKVVVSIILITMNVVCCKSADLAGNEYFIAFVYGSPYLQSRAEVWNSLTDIMKNNGGKWVLIGDFNQVEYKEQKLGGSDRIQGANIFMDWKIHNKLLDIPYQGVTFTWTNNRSNEEVIYERIDKAYCNLECKNHFPDAETWNLPILLSDHSPIILHLQVSLKSRKARPYRLDAWSLNYEEVRNIIKEEWKEPLTGSSSFILQRKL